jgi:SAM-dependent methyltransferase
LGQLLAGSDQGVEWGSGNSTAWLAERTKHLTSFETNPEYFARVREGLRSRDITNVDYRLIPFQDSDSEEEMLRSEWVQSASAFIDDSLDFVLVDSSPRGCLCAQVAGKLRRGGILVLDNANWYLPPPRWLTPAPGSVSVPLGFQGSRVPESTMSPRFLDETKKWRRIWTSDGVQMTLVFIKT